MPTTARHRSSDRRAHSPDWWWATPRRSLLYEATAWLVLALAGVALRVAGLLTGAVAATAWMSAAAVGVFLLLATVYFPMAP